MAAAILLIDDDPDVIRLVGQSLRSVAPPFEVEVANSASSGLERLAAHPVDGVLLDYRLPDAGGLTCLLRIRQAYPRLPVVVFSGSGSEDVAVEALKLGASDYVVKHGNYLPRVASALREALGRSELQRLGRPGNVDTGPAATPELSPAFRKLLGASAVIGSSPVFATTLALAERAASSTATVLLMGESGTGKEVLARVLHEHGPRARGPIPRSELRGTA